MKQKTFFETDYLTAPVPLEARHSLLSVTLVRVGMITALSQFMLGATLGYSMTFAQAMLATFLGSVILQFISLGLGIAGVREGLSTSLLARWCGFGRMGSVLFGMAIVISSLGWFGVQNAVFAKSLEYALGGRLGFVGCATLSGAVLTVLVVFGFRALSWTAKCAVPLFFLVIVWIFLTLLQQYHMIDIMTSSLPVGAPMTLSAAVTAVTGGFISAAIITPDISRYCQNQQHVFYMTLTTIIVGEIIVCGLAAVTAHALGTADVVTIMIQTSGWIGLLCVILAAIKVNDVILYSASLALANILEGAIGKKYPRLWLTMISGVIGTMLSIMGILDKFTDFLIMLGVVFPPISGVMLVDYYILRTSRSVLEAARQAQALPARASVPLIGWHAIAACVVGALAGITVESGIPSLNSLLVASLCYWLTHKICKK
ncbi:MAG: cytosine permease [Candidatus Hamiltonella defensa (Ceratovacuna japonica)]